MKGDLRRKEQNIQALGSQFEKTSVHLQEQLNQQVERMSEEMQEIREEVAKSAESCEMSL